LVTLKDDVKVVECTNLNNTVQQSVTKFSEIIFTNLVTLKAVAKVELDVKCLWAVCSTLKSDLRRTIKCDQNST
jgi:hypothetical protein